MRKPSTSVRFGRVPRRCEAGWPLPGALLLCVTAGCQSYEAQPLDRGAHRAAFHGRTIEVETVRAFVSRLELTATGAEHFDPADGISLQEGQLAALVFNRDLRLARLRLERSAAGAAEAGRWADPRFSFNLMRITDSVPDPWVVAPQLVFTFPLSGRLAVEREVADAGVRAARSAVREAEWTLWFELASAWYAWSAAERRVQETAYLVDAMSSLVATASQLAAQGELAATEAGLFSLEQAQRRNQLLRLRGEAAAAEQRVRTLIGLAPDAPVEFLPSLDAPESSPLAGSEGSFAPAGHAASDRIEALNPGLARLRVEYDLAEETLHHEIRKQYPDLGLGPMYETDAGQSRVGFFGSLPIPMLNLNRRSIAEAAVGRDLARAALEAEYEAVVGRYAAAEARAQALAEQRREMEEGLVPLVDRQLEHAAELMRLGEGTSLVLLESLTRAFQTKLDLIDARAQEARARTELAYLIGPADALDGTEGTKP